MKVALVVQRYGTEVLGGAESLARRVAEMLAPHVELEVLTTCALDYLTWADHYPPGPGEVNGVRVLRFSVPLTRDPATFDAVSARAYASPKSLKIGKAWMAAQGPNAPDLLRHLHENGSLYDAVIFITYLYATTVDGLPLVAERSILCPTVHDEPPLRLAIFDEVFRQARLCLFSTPEERELAAERFGVPAERARVVGTALGETPEADPTRFVRETGLARPYVLYHGRLDASKGIPELLDYHVRYRAARPDGIDLVLIGGGNVELPTVDGFHALGYVSEELKHDAIAGARIVVCPSPYESLSFSQLEAWAHGRPTLSNSASQVLVGQSRRSGGGLWYSDAREYVAMLDFLAGAEPLSEAIGAQGRRFVGAAYAASEFRQRWLDAIEAVTAKTAVSG